VSRPRRKPLPRTAAALTGVALLTACSTSGPGNWEEALDHVGDNMTICGPVKSVRTDADDTFVNVGEDYPDEGRFVIVVWDIGDSDLTSHEGDDVCVSGTISEYDGVAQIEVRDPDELEFGPAGTADDRVDGDEPSDTTEVDAGDDSETTTEPAVSRADGLVMKRMRVHSRSWNEALSPIVADYLDPNVSGPAWVEEAGRIFGVLEPKVRGMAELANRLANPRLRRAVFGVVANYRDKLEALTLLVSAVSAGNASAERSAALQVQSAAAEGNRFASRLARVSRQLGCPPSVCISLE
jgi:hypothetical protein